MKATSAANKASVFTLLAQGYSVRDIEKRTGLGKSPVGRIRKEFDGNKENHAGGCPAKLSPRDKSSIIRQIQSGRLDNAVEATQFINSTLENHVSPHTVRRVLRNDGLKAGTKKKVPMLKKGHRQKWLEFALRHENWTVEDWIRVL